MSPTAMGKLNLAPDAVVGFFTFGSGAGDSWRLSVLQTRLAVFFINWYLMKKVNPKRRPPVKNRKWLFLLRQLLIVLAVAFLICSCGEVALQRKNTVVYHLYAYNSPGANFVIPAWIIPNVTKKYDTKPNIPLDLSVPLMGRGIGSMDQIPPDTGTMIIIWSAKPAVNPPAPEEETK
jgi:hypothetical protein